MVINPNEHSSFPLPVFPAPPDVNTGTDDPNDDGPAAPRP
jgi:hypothetical protein